MKSKIEKFFQQPWLSDYRTLAVLWGLLTLFCIYKIVHGGHPDYDYLIFTHSFDHAWANMPLYPLYEEDTNYFLYGPTFAALIAPFAWMPDWVGQVIWELFITFFLFFTIRISWLTKYQQIFIFWFCIQEVLNCVLDAELNTLVVSGIMLSFLLVEKEKDQWATFFIAMGTMTKLFGVAGLLFFFFSKHKGRFVWTWVVWMVVFAALPMLVFGFDYTCNEYVEWMKALAVKNDHNLLFETKQNISLLGLVRNFSGCTTYSDIWVFAPCALLFFAPMLRTKQYRYIAFRETMLSSTLICICILSTSTEAYGYIIAMLGVVIWYTAAPWKRGKWAIALMVFAFVLTSLTSTDIFPKDFRMVIMPRYALKALPVSLIWFVEMWELLTRDYRKVTI